MQLLLVHGALGSASQLEPLRQAIGQGPAIRIVELEGHGDTAPTGDRYSMQRFAENIDAAIQERAIVFGYSMGGYAALMLAAQRPERVASVITLGTKLAWSPEVAARETARLDPATIRAKVPKFAEQLELRHRGAGGWDSVLGKTARLMTEIGSLPPVNEHLFARIGQTVRLMVGDRDTLVSVDETATAVRRLAQGQLAVLPGTPHPIEQVRPGLVAAMINDLLV